MPGYKLYLQEGGEVHEGLKCSHCKLVLKDPIQTSQTGQRYCKECFEDARWFDYAMCELVLFYWPYFNRSSTSELAQLMIDCNDVVSDSYCGAWANSWNAFCKILSCWLVTTLRVLATSAYLIVLTKTYLYQHVLKTSNTRLSANWPELFISTWFTTSQTARQHT